MAEPRLEPVLWWVAALLRQLPFKSYTEQYFSVALFIQLDIRAVTFQPVDEILGFDYTDHKLTLS